MADDTFTVERSAHVDAPPARVYGQVADFHSWRSWSPWEDLDPDMRRSHFFLPEEERAEEDRQHGRYTLRNVTACAERCVDAALKRCGQAAVAAVAYHVVGSVQPRAEGARR